MKDIGFNISHSENILALAVGFGVEVGVDVEVLDGGRGTVDFYRDWTVQEAASKLVGTGIALRGRAPLPAPLAVRSLSESVGGKEVILALAISDSECYQTFTRVSLLKTQPSCENLS